MSQPNNCIEESLACHYMKQLFEVVNEVHKKGIMHRDIEPKNIMITKDNNIKLIDFGVAKSSKRSNSHVIVGAPYYMAPEVLEGKIKPTADIWSLGVVLYVLLSGYLPF